MTRTLHSTAVLAAVAALSFAGCGDDKKSDSGSSGGGGGGTASSNLQLSADPGGALKFDKTSLTAKAGKVTINFDNPSTNAHAVEVEGNGVEESSDTVTQKKTSVTVDLKPGKYEFYCPGPGHEQAGMKGDLTVK